MSRESRARPKVMDFPRLMARYGTEEEARAYLTELRWPDGAVCPKCAHKGASWITTRRVHECHKCGHQFTVRVGTIFHDSKLPLSKWFIAAFLMCESRKGISANQVRRMTGVSYKTAWHLTHRIREAMSQAVARKAAGRPLAGTVEMDETYIGGKPRHHRKGPHGWDPKKKTMVMGAVERGGDIRLKVELRGANMGTVKQFVTANVDAENVYTDAARFYKGMVGSAQHESVDHMSEEWVRGDVHTNTIESAWSLFKRSIVGSYHHLSAKHMDKYLDEFEWRYNHRADPYLFRDTMKALLASDALTYTALKTRPA